MGPRSTPPSRASLAPPSAPRLAPILLIGALVALLLSLLPARLFVGKTYVRLTYTLAESGTRPAGLGEVAARLNTSLRGRADFEVEDDAHLVVDVDDTRLERAKRGIERRAPELRLVGEQSDVRTSAVTFALPVLVSLAWLVFVRRFDRAHPEPWLLMLLAFGAGLCAAWGAGTLQWLVAHQFPEVPAALQRLAEAGAGPGEWALGSIVALLYAGVLEEAAKLAAFYFAVSRRREFDEPVDGIVYAAAISLGFAAAENIRYFADGNLAPALVVGRAFVAVPTHVFLAAIWGQRLGERLVQPTRVWPAIAAAALLHAAFDVLSISARGPSSLVLPFAVAGLSLFLFAGLRRTLRHGPTRTRAALRAQARTETESHRFATGSAARFGVALGAFFVCAFGLVAFASAFQAVRPTALVVFALGAAALVVLLAVTGFAVTEALPLDVEVDRNGLRFAGASYPWLELTADPTPYRRGLLVVTKRAPLYVGPLPAAQRDELARRIVALRDEAPPASSLVL